MADWPAQARRERFRGMGVTMPSERNEQFFKRGMGIQEILQAVEDMLIDGGYDHYIVVTEHGTFSWETVDRARAREAGKL
jgi:hypothetical protein